MRNKDEIKRNSIREATIKLVAVQGIAGVKMALIAKKSGLSPSTLYVYYNNKEELLSSVFTDVTASLFGRIKLSDTSLPYKLLVKEYFEQLLLYKVKKANEYTYIRMFVTSPYYNEEMKSVIYDRAKHMIELVLEGQKQMILKDKIDYHILLAAIDGMSDKLVEYRAKGAINIDRRLIDDSFEVVWDGIKQ